MVRKVHWILISAAQSYDLCHLAKERILGIGFLRHTYWISAGVEHAMTVLETVTRGVGQVLPSAFADQITFLSSYGTGTNNSDTGIAQIQIIIWLYTPVQV